MRKSLNSTMVKNLLFLIAVLFFIAKPKAQVKQCNCKENFAFVKSYIEQNHAAFSDNITLERRKEYDLFCEKLKTAIQFDSCKTNCAYFISLYLEFFKDKHIYIQERINNINENDTAAVAAVLNSVAYKSTETMALSSSVIETLKKKRPEEVEGIYYSYPFPGYTVALTRTDKKYKAVILESSSVLWKKGQVKFVLTPEKWPAFDAVVLLKDHTRQRKKIKFYDGTLEELYFTKRKEIYSQSTPLFEFSHLNDSTTYLHVTTFSGPYFNYLDSCYKAHYNEIISKPFLVIDVRNNGGGSENCYQGLIDFIYTGPMKNDIADMYVTPQNLTVYKTELQKELADSANYGAESIRTMQEYVAKMEKAPIPSFIPMDGDKTTYITRNKILPYPRKVALIYNHLSASSCEGFIFHAIQSSKVITFGENSGGYTGYGNVFAVEVPGSNLTVGCTTTRYREYRKYDEIGIAPQYKLNFNADWMNRVQKIMKKKDGW